MNIKYSFLIIISLLRNRSNRMKLKCTLQHLLIDKLNTLQISIVLNNNGSCECPATDGIYTIGFYPAVGLQRINTV